MYVTTQSKVGWTYAKRALAFAVVTVDGDEEGLLFLDRLPTAAEATAIRDYVGIRKRREVSAEAAAHLKAIGAAYRWKAAA